MEQKKKLPKDEFFKAANKHMSGTSLLTAILATLKPNLPITDADGNLKPSVVEAIKIMVSSAADIGLYEKAEQEKFEAMRKFLDDYE